MKKAITMVLIIALMAVGISTPAFALTGQWNAFSYEVKKNGELCMPKKAHTPISMLHKMDTLCIKKQRIQIGYPVTEKKRVQKIPAGWGTDTSTR